MPKQVLPIYANIAERTTNAYMYASVYMYVYLYVDIQDCRIIFTFMFVFVSRQG